MDQDKKKQTLVLHIIVTANNKKEDEKKKYLGVVEKVFNDMTHVHHVCDLYGTVHEDSLSFEDKFIIWQQIKFCCEQIVHNNSSVIEEMLLVMSSV